MKRCSFFIINLDEIISANPKEEIEQLTIRLHSYIISVIQGNTALKQQNIWRNNYAAYQ